MNNKQENKTVQNYSTNCKHLSIVFKIKRTKMKTTYKAYFKQRFLKTETLHTKKKKKNKF